MTIQEAIEKCDLTSQSTAEAITWIDLEALRIVVAAARAYSCERCGGTGQLRIRIGRYFEPVVDCPDCLEARTYLREHAK